MPPELAQQFLVGLALEAMQAERAGPLTPNPPGFLAQALGLRPCARKLLRGNPSAGPWGEQRLDHTGACSGAQSRPAGWFCPP